MCVVVCAMCLWALRGISGIYYVGFTVVQYSINLKVFPNAWDVRGMKSVKMQRSCHGVAICSKREVLRRRHGGCVVLLCCAVAMLCCVLLRCCVVLCCAVSCCVVYIYDCVHA